MTVLCLEFPYPVVALFSLVCQQHLTQIIIPPPSSTLFSWLPGYDPLISPAVPLQCLFLALLISLTFKEWSDPRLSPNCKYFLIGPCPITIRTSLYMFMCYAYICHFQWLTWYFTWRIKGISNLTCLKLSPDTPSILNMLPLESFPSQKMTTIILPVAQTKSMASFMTFLFYIEWVSKFMILPSQDIQNLTTPHLPTATSLVSASTVSHLDGFGSLILFPHSLAIRHWITTHTKTEWHWTTTISLWSSTDHYDSAR